MSIKSNNNMYYIIVVGIKSIKYNKMTTNCFQFYNRYMIFTLKNIHTFLVPSLYVPFLNITTISLWNQ